ncbi:hypothetical protein BJ878DRAFT_579211 [Calycina marina]|uniref:Uncharacterized protein n=1 Tax=Calycina marina TaxID=1763456 RepID=A0A9P8CAU1_9HELO|nr:hypothetical protein BJ878DRAFT_579211 [Calycina marina]
MGSSPLTTVSSVYSPRHLSERPDVEEQIDRKKHEVVSANMAAQFISIVIDLYSNQPIESITTEFSNAPNTFHLDSPQFNCICQDDGAIWRRKFNLITKTWINPQSTLLCSLEAKSSYSRVDSSGMGVTSDRTLAQQFCELLGPVLSQVTDGDYEALDDEQRCRFLISVHQSDIMIVYCDFSPEYLGYMYSDQPPPHLPYITLHRSRKYNLGDPTERREAAETIVAFGEYFKQSI